MPSKASLFLLHGLGFSAELWKHVDRALADHLDCVALDLPGFGHSHTSSPLTVEETVDWVINQLRSRNPGPWFLVGHSLGGKIATLVAARAERGLPGLPRPLGLILVAASPPSPEPMDKAVRDEMLAWAENGSLSPKHAEQFIASNTSQALPTDVRERLRDDVSRASADAWRAWLECGSKEDWSAFAGLLNTPALIIAGGDDGPLGESCQRQLGDRHFRHHQLAVIAHAAHLIPVEQPEVLATLMLDFVSPLLRQPALPTAFARLLVSDRVSARTRDALYARLDSPYTNAGVFSSDQRDTLKALTNRLLPQSATAVDLVSTIETQLAAGEGDGWRLAELPIDIMAWRAGLDTINVVEADFRDQTADQQDAWISRLIHGDIASTSVTGLLNLDQMQLWMGEVRRATLRAWLSHPAAMAAIGYTGFATGGDGLRLQGYRNIRASKSDAWQNTVVAPEMQP